jgi:hypothetical protein
MHTYTRGVILAALAVGFSPALARGAETIGVLAVSEPPGPSPELVDLTSQFRGVLAQATPGVLAASDLRQRMMGQTSTASLTELERAFAGAIATYQAGDYEAAVATLRAVLDDLEKLADSPETFRQWSRVMLRLARIEQTVGRRAEAQALLERVVRADPTVKVDLGQYPPSFAKQVDEVRAQLATKKTRKLTVSSTQKGARVYVDGREVGVAPVTMNLPPDRYRISGVFQELRAPSIRANLSEEDQVVSLDFSLTEALRPGSGPGLALAPPDSARRIIMASASLGLDRVVVTSFVHDGDVTFLQGSVFDVRRGSIQREGRLRLAGKAAPAGGLTALAAFLITGQPSQHVTPTPLRPVAVVPDKAAPQGQAPVAGATPEKSQAIPSASSLSPSLRGERTTSPLLRWGPAATLALAVGAGAYSYGRGQSAASYYTAANGMRAGSQLRPGFSVTTYNAYVSDGDSARSTAMISGGTAGAALIVTGVLGYLSYRQSGEVGPFRF